MKTVGGFFILLHFHPFFNLYTKWLKTEKWLSLIIFYKEQSAIPHCVLRRFCNNFIEEGIAYERKTTKTVKAVIILAIVFDLVAILVIQGRAGII